MMYYKNPKLRPSKGGYIVTATKYTLSSGTYDGEKHLGECEEVFKDGAKALARVDEMFKKTGAVPSPRSSQYSTRLENA